jgi:aspartate aminotransferase
VKTLALSHRAALLSPSPTLKITAKANLMKSAGEDVVSFAAGEPDFNTPEPIIEAAIDALRAGKTKYTPSAGVLDLKNAIVDKLTRDNGIRVQPEQVVVSCGAKHSICNALQVLIDPGDEVILIAPYWMTYAEQVILAGGTPVVVHTSSTNGFIPDHEALKAAVTPRTKAIMINSPSNPAGSVLPRATLKQVAALALRNDLWIISDEIYEKLIYGEEHVSVGSLSSEVLEHTITVNGCSKTYAMTGWRIGYSASPKPIAQAMSNLQDQVTSNPTSFAQYGAIAALKMSGSEVDAMRLEFQARRDLIVRLLSEIPGVEIAAPKGAFYVLPNFRSVLGGTVRNDEELANFLLESYKVATIPGSVFEAPDHLRLTYATGRADIQRGVARIADAVNQLRQ